MPKFIILLMMIQETFHIPCMQFNPTFCAEKRSIKDNAILKIIYRPEKIHASSFGSQTKIHNLSRKKFTLF